ncbi:hypothetical protein TRIATDRAFT_285904 [Trichoderma atroviride IMI 206040]|uniref:Uncharacterized protein n=1 Tax=Hypocrea atroviridis (strain ATCC 20476 / IMI 206040) TaxID=452589 RepID=G9P193_HYPAI|nr:uncharacterized protein TRIATDRAFT_285904 [Trichoderma atroviride IMI 206040]EHK43281.1 hypothetical protein TRIATDRAFT_285904 [Trichoderma atroviride IMI 206040]
MQPSQEERCQFYNATGTLSQRAEMARLWQSIVPEEAIACPFLIHGMLAVSALHVAGRRPSHRFRYERCCRQHQNQAIPEYRQAIQTISTDSVGRIFAMSYLVSILSLAAVSDNALRDEERHTEMQTSIDDIMAVVTVIRGIHAIVRPAHLRRRLMNSPYVILLTGHSPLSSSQRASLPAHVPSRYQMLRDECLKDLIAPNDHEVYKLCTEAIDLLEKVHRDVFSVKPLEDAEFSYLVKWIALVPSGFVTLIRERHAAALVILGDFAVIFKWLENIWFLKNWAANALRAIREATSPAGREWLNAVSCF